MIHENIYGHSKRLRWIVSHLNREDTIVELGCGTGTMITLPLVKMGYTVYGLDLDQKSIQFGQELFGKEGLDPSNLMNLDISNLKITSDVIIASEVLEHLEDKKLNIVLQVIREKLKLGGIFLVTVPNGHGWFEMESFLWFKAGIGRFLEKLKVGSMINKLKCILLGKLIDFPFPSTLSSSHHIQRFTYFSIQELLRSHGFEEVEMRGSVLIAGPFSNLLFTGLTPIMRLNCKLGEWFPRAASGFYVACRPCPEKDGSTKDDA